MKKVNIVSYIRQFAANSTRSRAYKRSFCNVADKVDQFSKYLGMELYSDSFNERMMEEFVYYLRSSDKHYKTSTIKSDLSKCYQMLDRAGRDGYKVNYTFRDVSLYNEEPFAIYLTEDEIYQIFALEGLSREQHAARERFVIACCTGLRFSDFSKITRDNLLNNKIKLRTRKNKAIVEIPQHWMVQAIIKRNKGELPMLKSQQAFNTMIKRIARKAGIRDKVLYEQTEGLRVVRKLVEKWKLVSSHTARRSLATNMHLRGIATKRIMLITAHKTEQSFFQYIRIDRSENAKILANHEFFTGKSTTVQTWNKRTVKAILTVSYRRLRPQTRNTAEVVDTMACLD